MTAVAGVAPRARVRPAPAPAAARRVLGTWHEPNTWTVGILLATGVAILARHPIAHALGTEVDTPIAPVTTAAPAAPPRSVAAVPALTAPLAPAPTHAPRDPFRALVVAGAAAVAPATAPTHTATAPAATPAGGSAPPAPAAAVACASTHRVLAGESLWSITARATGSTDTKRLSLAWHRVYDANRSRIGADPGVVVVGTRLCIPDGV